MKYQYKDFFDYIELSDQMELGHGQGRNRVLAARDINSGRKLAIKEVVVPRHASKKLREVTQREVKNMIVLGAECKHIVPLLDYRECQWENERGSGSNLLLVMPQYEKTLDTEMTERYRKYKESEDITEWYDPLTICTIGINICKALHFAHSRQLPDENGKIQKGVVHRDIKPENIFWDDVLKAYILGDFGSSKLFDGSTTKTRASGTSGFCAPEQNRDDQECGPWTDIYSLGIILYVLGNGGFFPFAGADEPLVAEDPLNEDGGYLKRYSERESDRCPLPDPCLLNKEMSQIILKACAFHPKDRYQTARDFMDDLEKAQIHLMRGQVNITENERSLFGGVLEENEESDHHNTAAELDFLKKSLAQESSGKKTAKTAKKQKTFRKSYVAMILAFLMIFFMFVKNFAPFLANSHVAPENDDIIESTGSVEDSAQTIDDENKLLYEGNGIKIIQDHITRNNTGDINLYVYASNDTKEDLKIRTNTLTINGKDLDPALFMGFLFGALPKEASNPLHTCISADKLYDAGIITEDGPASLEIQFDLEISDTNSQTKTSYTDVITLNVAYDK